MAEGPQRYGYNGRILVVDLDQESLQTEENPPGFYRTYLGGGLLGSYYLFKRTQPGFDPLSPENVLIFAPSVLTGAPVSGASRFNITAKSPLTGAIGDTQCGGDWGARLKHAGFDAVVITGRAARPVYLLIDRGKAELRDASALWGKLTGEAQALIRQELGDDKIEVAQIGPAGENLVRFACVTAGLSHFGGRTGLGAVMGAKNLKAIAVRGQKAYKFFDPEAVKGLARKGAESFKKSEVHQAFQKHGTALAVDWQKAIGNIATKNFQFGAFDQTDQLAGPRLTETLLKGNETCFGCLVRCKRVVEAEAPYRIEGQYGGPEFESLIMLGANLGLGDLPLVAKMNEVCNKMGLDTISAGAMIALAMECFEKGIIGPRQTSGLDLRFGNGQAALALLEMIASRQGLGDLLAEGYDRVVSAWGEAAGRLAVGVKNQPFPAHLVRVKPSQGLMYAVNPFGADHMSSEHDWIAAADGDVARGLGITDFTDLASLDEPKVRATALSQFYYSLLDTLTLCAFCWGPGSLFGYEDLGEFVRAVTGWKMTFFELMKAGERRVNLMRAFNAREGFTRRDDRLPPRAFEPLCGGPAEGRRIEPEAFQKALDDYYALMGWETATGNPSRGKLMELGLGWVAEELKLK